MRGNVHVRFGGRIRETDQPKGRHRALVRAYTSIQARCRCHPTLPPGRARLMRVEHEYERCGAVAYLATYDVHRARVFGRCEDATGIAPFGRLVEQVMTTEPYASARRVFWIVDNGSSFEFDANRSRFRCPEMRRRRGAHGAFQQPQPVRVESGVTRRYVLAVTRMMSWTAQTPATL